MRATRRAFCVRYEPLTVMLYNRSSINYYAEIMFLRRLFRWLLLPKFTGFDRLKLEGHRKILRERKDKS